jgi:hypothetical protein
MEALPQEIQDLAILRRIIFASAYLPKDLPQYWSIVSVFASQGRQVLQLESVRIAVENIQVLNDKAFATDQQLISEMHAFSSTNISKPLGIVLISQNSVCKLCQSKLLVKADRPSLVTVYTESYGTVVGTHYHKVCRRGCSFRQYYGYSSAGKSIIENAPYDPDWKENKYFFSSRETAFELSMLKKFDVELLLGQLSYSQKAEIYNDYNGYPVQPKKCSTLEKDEFPTPTAR